MKFAIFGIGGVGGYLGAQLVRAGEEVAFIARGRHLDAIRARGLTVSSPQGEILARPAIATDDPASAGKADVVILGVKAGQVSGVAESIRPMLAPKGFVLPLQNGVEAADRLAAVLGRDRAVLGLCGMLSWVAGPGHIRTLGPANFVRVGEADNRRSRRTEALRERLDNAGINAEIPDDIRRALWEKFLFVVPLGGVGALTGQPFGMLRADEESRRLVELSMREIVALAQARNISLDADDVARTLGFVDKLPEEGTTSLQRDIVAGRPSELDDWTGAVVRLAAESGVEVPVSQYILESLAPREQKARSTTQ